VYIKNKVTLFLKTCIQAPITPFERHLKRNQKVPGWPRVVGATMGPFGSSPDISQRDFWELECGFAETELLCS
jgi:hypothetical protein